MKTEDIAVKMVLTGWNKATEEIQKVLFILPDEGLDMEIMPGRNKISWVVGHLAAVNDSLYSILGLGEILNEDYSNYFLQDGALIQAPGISQILDYWNVTNERLNEGISTFSSQDWFGRHTTVSAEDFAKEPHRNKLNVLLSRTYHLKYHGGQLALALKSIHV
jgi:hypothetical protein